MLAELTTERLSLNELTVADYAFIQELLNTEGWLRFIGDRNVHSSEEAIGYINRINGMENVQYWVVRLKEGALPVGIITYIKRTYLEHFDIGFAFLPQHSGKGYAYESAKAVLSLVLSEPKRPVVLATTLPHNTRSISLLTKLGLHFNSEIEVDSETLHVYSSAKNQPEETAG